MDAHQAVEYNYMCVLQQYLDEGGDPGEADRRGHTALHYAAELNSIAAVRLLCGYGASSYVRDKRGFTATMRAAELGFAAVVEELMLRGHSVAAAHHSKCPGGPSLVMLACGPGSGHADVLRLLLSAGESVRYATSGGCDTALHTAVRSNNFDAVVLLQGAGADMRARTAHGDTVLHTAARGGSAPLTEYIARYGGVDVNALNLGGETALHCALRGGSVRCAGVLLRCGVETSTRDIHGRALINYMAEAPVSTFQALPVDWAAPQWCDQRGSTLLHLAVLADNAELTQFLCLSGLNVNVTDARGDTPLHLAVMMGRVLMVDALLHSGASTMIRNKEKETARDLNCVAPATAYRETEVQKGISRVLDKYQDDLRLSREDVAAWAGLVRV